MYDNSVINDVFHIAFDMEEYETDEEFWADIATQMRLLTKNGYECKFYYEDCGIYIVEYATKDHEFGGSSCVWVSAEEHDMINDNRWVDDEDDEDEIPFPEVNEDETSGEVHNDK